MARTMREQVTGRRWLIGVMAAAGALGLSPGMFQAAAQETPDLAVRDFGVVPRPTALQVLLEMEPVRQELKLTDAQHKELEAVIRQQRRQTQTKMQQARRKNQDSETLRSAQADIAREERAAIRQVLSPEQWERLGQIQLQAQGPLAFRPTGNGQLLPVTDVGSPMAERLGLSDDQMTRIRAIVAEGDQEITKAASFPISRDPKDKLTAEAIRRLVDSPEFQAARRRASQAGRERWAAVIRRIEEVLTEPQRRAYHEMLGAPFDLSRLTVRGAEQGRQLQIEEVARILGVGGTAGGGQRADLDFNTRVARPAYAVGPRHPRVLFDEAHHNFHTAAGRYKPFADLIASDGYLVLPNPERFTRDVLQKGDILVIANALGAERQVAPGASNPAFTDAECDAVRDWVRDGGALLLITDHAPMGAAAECLARRFGVDVSKGATGDPVNSEGNNRRLIFSRANHLLADHPITRGRDDSERLNRVQTFTGTSLKGPAGSVPILKLADTAVDHSVDDEGKDVPAAGRAQGLAFAFGQGRVVVLGEAAQLSAQIAGQGRRMGMNVPGIDNRQMALNIMHWLSGLLEPREGALKKVG